MKSYLSEKNSHPRDSHIRLEPETHTYYVYESPVNTMSCTTWIHTFFDPFNAEEVARRIVGSKRHREDETYKYYQLSADEIVKKWTGERDAGTQMHESIEMFLNDPDKNISGLPTMFMDFLRDHPHLRPYRTEWMIYTDAVYDTHRLCGAIDAVFEDTTTGEYVIVDWKRVPELNFKGFGNHRGKSPFQHLHDCNFSHYCLQLNLYRLMLHRFYGCEINSMLLVQIHPSNDSYIKIAVPVMEREASDLLQAHTLHCDPDGFSPDQRKAFDLMRKGQNVFITGYPGTGKSTIIGKFIERFKSRRVIGVTAMTGMAAVLVKGQTLHSYLGIGLGTGSVESLLKRLGAKSRSKWRALDTLIIDEISMMSPTLFDKIERLGRIIRANPRPFGGIQVVLSGDFCFASTTGILMHDNSEKLARDIVIGDQLMGDDFTPRIVSRLFEGQDALFSIYDSDDPLCLPYTVTSNHTLCLRFIRHRNWTRTALGYSVTYWDNRRKRVKSKVFTGSLEFHCCKVERKATFLQMMDYLKHSTQESNIAEMTVVQFLMMSPEDQADFRGWRQVPGNPPRLYPIRIEEAAYGQYNGFETDGNRRFLLVDSTVVHNCQLPPVVESGVHNVQTFCFESEAWSSVVYHTIALTYNFRCNDPVLQNILDEVRIGDLSEVSASALRDRIGAPLACESLGVVPTRLFGRNVDVNRVNEVELDKVGATLKFNEYVREDIVLLSSMKEDVLERRLNNCGVPPILQLCIGAQVMFMINKDPLVNGSRGVVVDFQDDCLPMVKFAATGKTECVGFHTWCIEENEVPILKVSQIPLRVAYALTIHRAMGATLDAVEIDISNLWESGQCYVGLSRVRDMQSLRIVKDFSRDCVVIHPKVRTFYQNLLQ